MEKTELYYLRYLERYRNEYIFVGHSVYNIILKREIERGKPVVDGGERKDSETVVFYTEIYYGRRRF